MWKRPKIKHGKPTKYGWTVYYPDNFRMGVEVDIGWGTFMQADSGVEIGDGVQIGGGCHIYSVNSIDGTSGRVVIKGGARIGAHSVILPGVTIGSHAVVGAMSLVKSDVPSLGRYAGVPARDIKSEVEDEDYWMWWLKKAVPYNA